MRVIGIIPAKRGSSLFPGKRPSVERVMMVEGDEQTAELDHLLAQNDFACIHTDSRFDNRHLTDARRYRLMRPSAVLVNNARGALIDKDALAHASREGRLAGAVLDVIDQEPFPAASPLRSLSTVYASHNSNRSSPVAASVHASTIGHVLWGIDTLMP